VVVLLAAAGIRSIALVAVGVEGIVVTLVGAWWFLVHRGVRRWRAGVLMLAAPTTAAILYARAGLLWVVAVCAALWSVAVAPAGPHRSGPVDAATRSCTRARHHRARS
jgi:hypothetical protein